MAAILNGNDTRNIPAKLGSVVSEVMFNVKVYDV